MSYTTLLVEKHGAVDWLTLNRPDALNSLSLRMVAELHDYFDSLQKLNASFKAAGKREILITPARVLPSPLA